MSRGVAISENDVLSRRYESSCHAGLRVDEGLMSTVTELFSKAGHDTGTVSDMTTGL